MIQPKIRASISCSVAENECSFVLVICRGRTQEWESVLMYKKEEGSCVLIYSRTIKMKTDLKFRQLLSFLPVLTIDSCVLKCVPLREVLF